MTKAKQEIISFKADPALLEALKGVENRSAFIRAAVLTALGNLCPLCQGSGILSPSQRQHWEAFARHHKVQECDDCHEYHIVCDQHDQHTHGDEPT